MQRSFALLALLVGPTAASETSGCAADAFASRAALVTASCCSGGGTGIGSGHRRLQRSQAQGCERVPTSCTAECATVFSPFFRDCREALAGMAQFRDYEVLDAACGTAGASAATRSSVLFVVSGAAAVPMTDGSSMAAGFWAGEFAVPARALLALGFTVDVATPGGAVPVPDTHSLSSGQSQHSLQQEFPALLHPLVLEDIDPTAAFDVGGAAALIIPGGYSPMVDLRSSAALSALLLGALERQLVIASICHGPSAFLSTLVEGEEWPFSGARMIAFTDEEEANWLRDRVSLLPWTVQSALEDAGADFQRSPGPWRSEVVVDSRLNLVTGQSSPSTQEWTQAILAAL